MAEYKGDIKGFPKEVVDKMIAEMKNQGRATDITSLEKSRSGGFSFEDTSDGFPFWRKVVNGDFDLFFEKYPKATTEFKGEIEGFPKEVVDRMLREAEIQGRSTTIEDLEDAKSGGFEFTTTKDGWVFWRDVIDGDFDLFFAKYPKATTEFKGEIEGFPKEVVEKMLDEQEKDGNARDVSYFERNVFSTKKEGGFDWATSVEGDAFWNKIINDDDFSMFFEKYPKSSEPSKEEEEPEIEKAKYTTIDEFIAYNQSELQDMEKNNPPVFDALNDVLAELRIAYEGAKPVKKKKKTVRKKTPKPKAVEEEIDLDSLMNDMDDTCELVIDDILCEIDDLELE
tara:strand:- start:730 stop:1746 length:1017 start_codon:yes stop_codon:yes gene_type:complete